MKRTRRSTAIRKGSKISACPRDAVDLLERMIATDREMSDLAEEATLNAMVAQLIYQCRMDSGLTQGQLAKRIGTRQSVISRLEDADYRGHSLSMLRRIGEAMGKQLELRFVRTSTPRAA